MGLVSGPRTVIVTLPWCLVTTISQRLSAIERNEPPPSLWARHTRSTYGESDGRSSMISTTPPPGAGAGLLRELAMETGLADAVSGALIDTYRGSLCICPGMCSRTWRWRSLTARMR